MNDVPKIVRQRTAQQPAGEHPDANLLAAFAEGGLTQGEHAQLLAHLGTCAACRDVVAFALPESVAAAPAAAQAGKSWLRWPVLRWAGAAAAAVVVAAAVLIVKPHPQAPAPMKQTEAAVPTDKHAAKPAETPAAVPIAPAPPDQVRRKDSAPASASKQEPKSKVFEKEDASGALESTDAFGAQALKDAPAARDLDRMAKKNEAVQLQAPEKSATTQSQVPAVPANAQPVPAQSAKAQPQAPAAPPPPSQTAAGAVGGVVALQKRAAVPPSQPAMTAESVQVEAQSQVADEQRAKQQLRAAPQANDSVAVNAATAMAAHGAGRPPMTNAMMRPVTPRWRVSSEGELERSMDAGDSWQTVRVAGTPVSFRSVSTVNRDVWAGGTGGVLYHSADDGRTWTRVTVKALDMVLATDIARVEFIDTLHGAVTTATGVKWITADAGVTWSLVAKPPR